MKQLILSLVLVLLSVACDLYQTNDTVDITFQADQQQISLIFDREPFEEYIASMPQIETYRFKNAYCFRDGCDISVTHKDGRCTITITKATTEPNCLFEFRYTQGFECSNTAWRKYKKDYGITELNNVNLTVVVNE